MRTSTQELVLKMKVKVSVLKAAVKVCAKVLVRRICRKFLCVQFLGVHVVPSSVEKCAQTRAPVMVAAGIDWDACDPSMLLEYDLQCRFSYMIHVRIMHSKSRIYLNAHAHSAGPGYRACGVCRSAPGDNHLVKNSYDVETKNVEYKADSARQTQDGPRRPHDGPKRPQEAPRTA